MSHRTRNSTNQVLLEVYAGPGTALYLNREVAADSRCILVHSIPYRALANLYTYNVSDGSDSNTQT